LEKRGEYMTSTLAQRRKDMLKHEKGEKRFSKKPHLKETIVKVGDGKRDRKLVAVKDPRSKSHRIQNARERNKHQDLEFTQAKSELTLLIRRVKKHTKEKTGDNEKTLKKLEEIEGKLKIATKKKEIDGLFEEIIKLKIEEDREMIRALQKGLRIVGKLEKKK
jgi:hypothetical protein